MLKSSPNGRLFPSQIENSDYLLPKVGFVYSFDSSPVGEEWRMQRSRWEEHRRWHFATTTLDASSGLRRRFRAARALVYIG